MPWSDIVKEKIKYILAIISFITSILIGFIALFLPPTGEIDSSVLWFTAQMLMFCATCLGMDLTIERFKKK